MTRPFPTPRGALTPNRPLADLTWLRVGGPADWLFQPADEADLRRMLALLSGRRHHCLSAVCLIGLDGRARVRLSDTVVAFKRLSDAEIDRYIACGEGLGKAGGYAIQGRAEAFVRFIEKDPALLKALKAKSVYEAKELLDQGIRYRTEEKE